MTKELTLTPLELAELAQVIAEEGLGSEDIPAIHEAIKSYSARRNSQKWDGTPNGIAQTKRPKGLTKNQANRL